MAVRQRGRRPLGDKVVLDWDALPPLRAIELTVTTNLTKQESRSWSCCVLTYFHYASRTRPDVFAARSTGPAAPRPETQDGWRS